VIDKPGKGAFYQTDFDLIVSSPLVRARQTAEIVAEVLKFRQPLEEWGELAPEGSVDAQQEANPLIRINANGEGPQALKPRGGPLVNSFHSVDSPLSVSGWGS